MAVPGFKPETVETFKQLCSEKWEALVYMREYGSPIEKVAANLILDVGGFTCGYRQK